MVASTVADAQRCTLQVVYIQAHLSGLAAVARPLPLSERSKRWLWRLDTAFAVHGGRGFHGIGAHLSSLTPLERRFPLPGRSPSYAATRHSRGVGLLRLRLRPLACLGLRARRGGGPCRGCRGWPSLKLVERRFPLPGWVTLRRCHPTQPRRRAVAGTAPATDMSIEPSGM